MNTFNRNFAFFPAIVAAGLLASFSVNAEEGKAASDSPSCHQVTKRVAVWPVGGHPSKGLQLPKYETRTLTVCDHERAKPDRSAAKQFGPRYR